MCKYMNENHYTRDHTSMRIGTHESKAMRGIAIMAIMLHNFAHWLAPMVRENEYQFNEHNVRRLMVELSSPTMDIFAQLMSFFGHYGVPVFVFLSAYGLVMKYESKDALAKDASLSLRSAWDDAWQFVVKHYKKLFFMMIVGYSVFMMVDFMTPHPYSKYSLRAVLAQLLMMGNLHSEPHHAIWPGPYWYFGLMVQLYVFYRFVLYPGKMSLMGMLTPRVRNIIMVGIILVTLFAQLLFEPNGDGINWYRYNMFGSLPVFIAGTMFARMQPRQELTRLHWALTLIIALFMILFFSMNFACWIIVPFFICVATVAFVKVLPQFIYDPFVWIGNISAAIFVCHPITRKVLIPIAHHGDIYAGLLLYVVVTLVFAMAFKKVIGMLDRY